MCLDSSRHRTTVKKAVIFVASGMEAIMSRYFPQTARSGTIFQPRFLNLRNVSIYKASGTRWTPGGSSDWNPTFFRLAGDRVTLKLHQVWSCTVVVVSQIKTLTFLIHSWLKAISCTFLPFTPSALSGKSKVSFNQVWAWTDVMFTDWDSGFQKTSGTSGLLAWQRAQQIANPKDQVHKQLWSFHPVTRKPGGQWRWYHSSLLNPAALLPVCFVADLCVLSESSD